ncbi:MAG: Ig-like domain-containing protein [Promethearchaeota archaeon]
MKGKLTFGQMDGDMNMDIRKTALVAFVIVVLTASLVVIFISFPSTPSNGETDTVPPVVTITGPSNHSIVFGAEAITFTATDANGVSRAEIYIDGVIKAVGQSYNWNTMGVEDGQHTIVCRARDPYMNWADSTIIVTVNNSISFASEDFQPIFKVMAYNIQESGINPDWKEVVKEEDADIIMFVETGYWDDGGSAGLINAVNEFNAYFVNEDPYEGFCTQGIAFSTSGEAVLSRFPVLAVNQIQSVFLDDATGYDVTHDFLDAVIDINGTSVHFVGCHLKAGGGDTNEARREWENEGIINYFDSLGDVPIVYLGDLNSVSPFDVGPLAPYWDPGVGPLTMLLNKSDPTYGQFSSEVHNFTDVFRTLNPTDPGYTFGSHYTQETARIDYILTNQFFEDMLINSTVGDTAHALTGSDHYSVDAFINWTGGVNMFPLAFHDNKNQITGVYGNAQPPIPDATPSTSMMKRVHIDAGSSDKTVASVSTKVAALVLVMTRGGLIIRTLL